jgi:hypothetical protein
MPVLAIRDWNLLTIRHEITAPSSARASPALHSVWEDSDEFDGCSGRRTVVL